MKTLGENIRELRKRKGFSQLQLGDALGCSDKTISSWETNRTEPDKKMYLENFTMFKCVGFNGALLVVCVLWQEADGYGNKKRGAEAP